MVRVADVPPGLRRELGLPQPGERSRDLHRLVGLDYAAFMLQRGVDWKEAPEDCWMRVERNDLGVGARIACPCGLSELWASAVRDLATCEKCGNSFVYDLTRLWILESSGVNYQ